MALLALQVDYYMFHVLPLDNVSFFKNSDFHLQQILKFFVFFNYMLSSWMLYFFFERYHQHRNQIN